MSRGILTPFRRDQRQDFASGEGDALLFSQAEQVLATEEGELPWRTSFGAGLHRVRHRRNDVVLQELVRVGVRDALARWLMSARVPSISVDADDATLRVDITLGAARRALSLRR